MVVCRLGDDEPEVLCVRTGSNGVGASAIRMGESLCGTAPGGLVYRWHWNSQVPCFLEFGW